MASLFGGQKAPVLNAPAPIPDTSSPQVLEARRQATADALARAGRASTIATDASRRGDSGGGSDSYSANKLGGA